MKTGLIWWQHKQKFGVTYFPLELHLHSPYACGMHEDNFEIKTKIGVKHTPLSSNLVVTAIMQILPIVTKHKNQY
jgi:hypothetical protein